MQKMFKRVQALLTKMSSRTIVFFVLLFLFFPFIYRILVRNIKAVLSFHKELSDEERHKMVFDMRPEEYQTIGETIRQKYNVSIEKFEELKISAQNIAYHLGTLVGLSWYQRLTENDREAYEELKKVAQYFDCVSELYYYYYTKSDNLRRRIIDDLDVREYVKLKRYYKQFNIHI